MRPESRSASCFLTGNTGFRKFPCEVGWERLVRHLTSFYPLEPQLSSSPWKASTSYCLFTSLPEVYITLNSPEPHPSFTSWSLPKVSLLGREGLGKLFHINPFPWLTLMPPLSFHFIVASFRYLSLTRPVSWVRGNVSGPHQTLYVFNRCDKSIYQPPW